LLVIIAALSLAACGKGASSKPLPRIGFLLPGKEADGIASAILLLAQGRAELLSMKADGLRGKQSDQLDALLKDKVRTIIIACVDPEDAGAFIDKAKAAKVPVVFSGARPAAADMVKWDRAYYVGTDPATMGKAQGELAASLWARGPASDRNRDGIMQYAVLRGHPSPGSTEMTQGLLAYLEGQGQARQKLADATSGTGREGARQLASAWALRLGQGLEVVLGQGGDEALGAAQALASRGPLPIIIATGADNPALSAIASGEILGTIAEDIDGEAKATMDLAALLAGTGNLARLGWTISENKYLWVAPVKITKDNLAAALGKPSDGTRR